MMNNTNNTVSSTKGTSKLVRARFGPGMLLQHEDLEQLNIYTRDLSRLLFQSFFGCGVICGLVVKTESSCGNVKVTVDEGVALACSGDPIYVPPNQKLVFDENSVSPPINSLWVVLCGTVKRCAPRTAICSSDDDEAPSEPTREKDGFEIRVVSSDVPPPCVCGCAKPAEESDKQGAQRPAGQAAAPKEIDCLCADPTLPCYKEHYAGTCGCNCDECSDCDCKCILLAKLVYNGDDENPWRADHSVRRFIRPVLMRDPQVVGDQKKQEDISPLLALKTGGQNALAQNTAAAHAQLKPIAGGVEDTPSIETPIALPEPAALQEKKQGATTPAKPQKQPKSAQSSKT
jgi:hypothetical protein